MTKAQKIEAAEIARQAKVQKWYDIHSRMKALQAEESTLRLEVAAECFGYDTNQLQKGSKKMPLPGDESNFELKCQFSINEKVEQEMVQDLLNLLAANGISAEIRAELFRVKYELRASIYKVLPDPAKAAVDAIMVRSPGMPQVSIESKKAKTKEAKQAFAIAGAKKGKR